MTLRKITYLLMVGAILFAQCSSPEFEEKIEPERLMEKSAIDDIIIKSLQKNDEFNWSEASDVMLWSALEHSDGILTIGYKPSGAQDISSRISSIDVSENEWTNARDEVIDETLSVYNAYNDQQLKTDDLEIHSDPVLPVVEMQISDIEVIRALRKSDQIRYVEPLGYEVEFPDAQSGKIADAGCDNSPNFSIPSSDFTTISPSAKLSWNYSYMGIPQAWNTTTGKGIGVGLIDTGVSPNQPNLNGSFNSGQSSGRYIQKFGTYRSSWWWWARPDGPDDKCGHGTSMAGVIAAPRSNNSVGVAYNCNLISYRGTGDVIINGGSEKTGVSDALVALGKRTDVKIISMSIGDVFTNSKVADAVRYAHGRGKLIFAAAGTSTSFTNWVGVIFPANMNETVAVTGIKEGQYRRCDICHSGSKVDFTVVMERSSSGNKPLTLANSGAQPSTVGGSSVATATAAGIAALVWAKNPSWTRSQVLDRLKQTADLYPNRNSQFGWGTLNAAAAVQ